MMLYPFERFTKVEGGDDWSFCPSVAFWHLIDVSWQRDWGESVCVWAAVA
jgi:hypothetical protein